MWPIFFLIAADQLSKYLAIKFGYASYNMGLSFGIGSGIWIYLLLLVGLFLVIFLFKKFVLPVWFKDLFLAGMVSNLIDRFAHGGKVVDWLPIPLIDYKNNLADWYLAGAVGFFILKYLYEHRNTLRR